MIESLETADKIQGGKNGFGKSAGLVQVEELGVLETPIALTNTLNVGKVWDALVGIVIEQCQNDGLEPMSINPVVGECNDCRINLIQKRAVGEEEVRQAFAAAAKEFEEGDVGAGAGTICYGMKGGIGSASRVICIVEKEYITYFFCASLQSCRRLYQMGD